MTVAEIKDIRRQFAFVTIGARRGIAAKIDKSRSVELQTILKQAQLMASTYAKEIILPSIHLSDAEIEGYMLKHAKDGLTRDQSRDALQLEKERSVLEEITSRRGENIRVPENFTVPPLTTKSP